MTAPIHELCERADELGIESLTHTERTVVLAWSARGIIGNGGFRYYFEGAWMMAEVAAAYRTLGFEAAARACEAALAVFPGGVPKDGARRSEQIAKTDWSSLAEHEERIWQVSWESLEAALVDYMKRHEHEFEHSRT